MYLKTKGFTSRISQLKVNQASRGNLCNASLRKLKRISQVFSGSFV